jgi:hypothetical protein
MPTIAETVHPVNVDQALLAATARAKAVSPDAAVRIEKGLALVRDDAVTDMTALTPGWYTVRSATYATTVYDVVSNGTTTCTCPDYALYARLMPHYCCKHAFAVLLVRAARRDIHSPRLRHAYMTATGEYGHCRHLSDGRAMFFPGGQRAGFACLREDLCIGAFVHLQGKE